jgi:hypothetical protein
LPLQWQNVTFIFKTAANASEFFMERMENSFGCMPNAAFRLIRLAMQTAAECRHPPLQLAVADHNSISS